MSELFKAIQFFFEEILFIPLDFLREVQFDSWWLANIVNWVFIIIGFCFFVYWIRQLKLFNDRKEDREDIVSHSFFKN